MHNLEPLHRRMSPARRSAAQEVRRAERLAERGEVAEAIATLDHAISLGAAPYTCYLRQARLYQSHQQFCEAVSAVEKAIAEQPTRLSAREAIIALHLETREYDRAISASKAWLKISPRHGPAHDALGAAYIGLGDTAAALRVANELIRIDPTSPSHRFTKAHLAQHLDDVSTAVEEFQRVVELAPESDLAENAREQLQVLDGFQLHQIMTLAVEDSLFRCRILRDCEEAVADRGFVLSESGKMMLHEATDGLEQLSLSCRPTLYH
jgi:Putative Zn-dependent protease, contains TPR repeats